jgi:hypothetical protein
VYLVLVAKHGASRRSSLSPQTQWERTVPRREHLDARFASVEVRFTRQNLTILGINDFPTASGGFTDRVRAISRLASDPAVDAIVGDWLSENVMTGYGAGKEACRRLEKERGFPFSFEEKRQDAHFASTFLQCFEPAIGALRQNGAKLVVNAGANDTEVLAEVVRRLCSEREGWEVKVAWVEGDEVTDRFRELVAKGHDFKNLCDGRTLAEWGYEPLCAQAYLGSLGISEALKQGADIVICGRVSDAAPTVGLSAWWHGWKNDAWDQLAGALIAGHLIECSAFITGGYYSGFKDLMKSGKHLNLGFPIAEVEASGECVIAKEPVGVPLSARVAVLKRVGYRRHRKHRDCYVSARIRDIRPSLPQLGCRRQPRERLTHASGHRPRARLWHHGALSSSNNARRCHCSWGLSG